MATGALYMRCDRTRPRSSPSRTVWHLCRCLPCRPTSRSSRRSSRASCAVCVASFGTRSECARHRRARRHDAAAHAPVRPPPKPRHSRIARCPRVQVPGQDDETLLDELEAGAPSSAEPGSNWETLQRVSEGIGSAAGPVRKEGGGLRQASARWQRWLHEEIDAAARAGLPPPMTMSGAAARPHGATGAGWILPPSLLPESQQQQQQPVFSAAAPAGRAAPPPAPPQ